MMRLILTVFVKETRDHVRDKRSLFSALLFPLIGPLAIALTLSLVASWMSSEKPLVIAVVGRENAPNLCSFLEAGGAHLIPAPADYERRIRDGDLDVAIVIPSDYGSQFESGHPARVELVEDGASDRTRRTVARAEALLRGYGHQIGVLRLLARGVNPALGDAIKVDDADVSTSQQKGATLLSMIPVFLLMGAFMGGMHVAIDSMAGERERGSLEPLLINPVTTATVVLGKWLATVFAGAIGVIVMLAALWAAVIHVPLEELGIRLQFGPSEALGLLAAVMPLVLLTSAVQLLVATFARSFREAQTYVSVVMLLPMAPGIVASLNPVKPKPWMSWIPALSQQLLMTDVMRGDPTATWRFVVAAAGVVVASAICLVATSRLLNDERIVFGR